MHQASMFFSVLSLSVFASCLETEEENANGEPTITDPETSRPITPTPTPHAPVTGRPEPHCAAAPPNLVANASFETQPIHACGWEIFDGSEWGVIASRYCYLDDHEGCTLYLAAKVWGHDWSAQLHQRLRLEPSGEYLLTFEAKAAGRNRSLVVAALNAGPLNGLGSGIELNLDTNWHTFAFPFRAGPGAEETILDFAFGGAEAGLYLDNVMLIPAPPPPAPDAGLGAREGDAQ